MKRKQKESLVSILAHRIDTLRYEPLNNSQNITIYSEGTEWYYKVKNNSLRQQQNNEN